MGRMVFQVSFQVISDSLLRLESGKALQRRCVIIQGEEDFSLKSRKKLIIGFVVSFQMNFLGKKSIKKGFVGQLFSPKIRTRNLSYKTKK